MKLITTQWKGILDILKVSGIYKAQYDHDYTRYIEQYKQLAKLCGFSSCPIFCAPIEDETSLYGITENDDHIKIIIDVPESRIKEMDYYGWSDYLYYSSGQEYDQVFNYDREQALANIDRYITIGTSIVPQYVIEEIYAKDIVE